MKVTEARFEIIRPQRLDEEARNSIYQLIEAAGRTCYQSGGGTPESAAKFIRNAIANQHFSILEHASMTVRFMVDRGITHEIVRHRLSSFNQESTRYCNYSKDKFGRDITYIDLEKGMRLCPVTEALPSNKTFQIYSEWRCACEDAERHYMRMLDLGASPQIARSVLNNSTKSELVMTANLREWRHFCSLRAAGTTGAPHPQMIEVAVPLLKAFADFLPEVFGDILDEVNPKWLE